MALAAQAMKLPYSTANNPFDPRRAAPAFTSAAVLLAVIVGGLTTVQGTVARGGSVWYEGFEGPQTTWVTDHADVRFQLGLHCRARGEAFTGQGCERFRLSGSSGKFVHFRHEVGQAAVIDELVPRIQVKSNRPGIQILARVVLPRSIDPRTGRPRTVLVAGTSYMAVGQWQQLRIDNFPERLTQRVRVLRADNIPDLDPREAYVQHILLNVYGGPGTTDVWVDDLDLAGYVAVGWVSPTTRYPTASEFSGAANPSTPPSRLVGSVIRVHGRAVLIRAIEYQGEPLALLKRLGFNTVWFHEPPAPGLLTEAAKTGLWAVCPPPKPTGPIDPAAPETAMGSIPAHYNCVVAWTLGDQLGRADIEPTQKLIGLLRQADGDVGRPLVCRPRCELRSYSQMVDVLLQGRPAIGTSLELSDYGKWIRQRPLLARPGTPVWTTVQTQPDQAIVEQWQAMGVASRVPTTLPCEQIRLIVHTAVTAGSRGLLFRSSSPLDATDAATLTRAMTLELLNLEMSLIEQWLADGGYVTTVAARRGPEVVAALLRTDRTRLLVPIWSAIGAQYVAGQSVGQGVSFVVPGVPEEYNAYLLRPGRLERLRHEQVAGGMNVVLDQFALTAMVVLTQDPETVNRLNQRAQRIARRAAELKRHLAADRFRVIAGVGFDARQAAAAKASARQRFDQCESLLARGDYTGACTQAEAALRPLRLLQRQSWQEIVGSETSPMSAPTALAYQTLPWHRQWLERLGSTPFGPNRLATGDFEDMRAMLQAGWNLYQDRVPTEGIVAGAELAVQAGRNNTRGLRLVAEAADEQAGQKLMDSPPVWMVSPPIRVEAGQVVVIEGWARVPGPIHGSVDGLMIVESIGDEVLAERLDQTPDWKHFSMYRVAPQSTELTLRFVLTGLGEAWIDDVSVRVLATGTLPPQLTANTPARTSP